MNKRYYLENVRQLKIPGFIGTVILSVIAFFSAWGVTFLPRASNVNYYNHYSHAPNTVSFFGYFWLLNAVGIIFVPIMMLCAFSFLHRRNSSDFYHAIPVKRQAMFGSIMLAVLSWAVAMVLIPTLIILFIFALDVCNNLNAGEVVRALFSTLVIILIVSGGFSVGVSATGTGFTNFVVSFIVVFVPRIVLVAVVAVISACCRTVDFVSVSGFFNIRCNTLFASLYNVYDGVFGYDLIGLEQYPSIGSMIYTTLLAAAEFGWGCLVFCRRKSEVAGSPNYNKWWQMITRLTPAFCISMVATLIIVSSVLEDEWIDSEMAFWLALIYIAATIAYFVYELITTKKWKSVAKAWKTYPILVALNVILFFMVLIPTCIYRSERLDAEDIKSVSVQYSTNDGILSLPMSTTFEDREIIEITAKGLNDTNEIYYGSHLITGNNRPNYLYDVNVSFRMKNGTTRPRRISLDSDQFVRLRTRIAEVDGNLAVNYPPLYKTSLHLYMNDHYYHVELPDFCNKVLYESWMSEAKTIEEYVHKTNADNAMGVIHVSWTEFGHHQLELPITEETPVTMNLLIQFIANDNMSMNYEGMTRLPIEEFHSVKDGNLYLMGDVFGSSVDLENSVIYAAFENHINPGQIDRDTLIDDLEKLVQKCSEHKTYQPGDVVAMYRLHAEYATEEEGFRYDAYDAVILMLPEEYKLYRELYPELFSYSYK